VFVFVNYAVHVRKENGLQTTRVINWNYAYRATSTVRCPRHSRYRQQSNTRYAFMRTLGFGLGVLFSFVFLIVPDTVLNNVNEPESRGLCVNFLLNSHIRINVSLSLSLSRTKIMFLTIYLKRFVSVADALRGRQSNSDFNLFLYFVDIRFRYGWKANSDNENRPVRFIAETEKISTRNNLKISYN